MSIRFYTGIVSRRVPRQIAGVSREVAEAELIEFQTGYLINPENRSLDAGNN
jgi:hypothetical protein